MLRSLPVNRRGQDRGSLSKVVEGTRSGRLRGRSAILRRAALREPPPLRGALGPARSPPSRIPLILARSPAPPRLSRGAGSRLHGRLAGLCPDTAPGEAAPGRTRAAWSGAFALLGGAMGKAGWCSLVVLARSEEPLAGSRSDVRFSLPLRGCPPAAARRLAGSPCSLTPRRGVAGGGGPAGRWVLRGEACESGQLQRGAAGAPRVGGESRGHEAGVPRAIRGARLTPLPDPMCPFSSEARGSAAAWPARRREPVLVPSWPLPLTYGSSVAQCRPLPRRFRIPSGDKP